MEQQPSQAARAATKAVAVAAVSVVLFAAYVAANRPQTPAAPLRTEYRLKIDLRTASAEELQLIPNFGPKLSEAWVRQRPELLTRYPDPLEAIGHVRGIGPAKVAELRKHVVAGSLQSTEPSRR